MLSGYIWKMDGCMDGWKNNNIDLPCTSTHPRIPLSVEGVMRKIDWLIDLFIQVSKHHDWCPALTSLLDTDQYIYQIIFPQWHQW